MHGKVQVLEEGHNNPRLRFDSSSLRDYDWWSPNGSSDVYCGATSIAALLESRREEAEPGFMIARITKQYSFTLTWGFAVAGLSVLVGWLT